MKKLKIQTQPRFFEMKATNFISSHFLSNNELYIEAISNVAIIAVTDVKGNIIYANNYFCDITGYSVEELIGKNHSLLNSGFHPKSFFGDMYKAIHSGNIWRGEIRNRKKNGDIYWVDTKIIPILNESKTIEGFLSIRFDITKRKMIEDILNHQSRLIEMGRVSNVVAHEINNALTIIDLGLVAIEKQIQQELEVSNEDFGRFMHKVNMMKNSTSRITNIVSGLKIIGKSQENIFKTSINLKRFFDEICFFCIQKKEAINYSIGDIPECEILGIKEKFAQVFINIINNAIEALESSENEDKNIYFNFEYDEIEQHALIRISNNGPKIPSEILDKIMLPHFSTKVTNASGLGLSLSKEIMQELDGDLYIDQDHVLTCFVIKIKTT